MAKAVVLAVFVVTKFVHGAWLVVLIIPSLVFLFRAIHKHYVSVANQLTTYDLEPLRTVKHEVIVPISGIHHGVIFALEYAKSISTDNVTAVYVEIEEDASSMLREKWEEWNAGVPLIVLKSPYRSLTRPFLKYVNRTVRNGHVLVTIVLPEFVPAKWWHQILHNQSSSLLKGILLFQKNVVVTNVRYYLEK